MLPVLLRWYDSHGRDLPWRHTRDPYKILVSEMMLQQTQVSRVIGYYHRWLTLFPNWATLAQAGTSAVIRAWSGLGYNRRALALQGIAKRVVKEGEPDTYAGWLALKGIGPYTAAAISVFAQHRPLLPIDTNIRRVLGRAFLGRGFPTATADDAVRRKVEPQLGRIQRFYDVPQALFDLANTHCLKTPDCKRCPLRASCAAAPKFLSGRVRVPKRSIAKARERIREGKRYPDRIYRGRILTEVQSSRQGTALKTLGAIIDTSFDPQSDRPWLEAMVSRLVKDGLLVEKQGYLYLPA